MLRKKSSHYLRGEVLQDCYELTLAPGSVRFQSAICESNASFLSIHISLYLSEQLCHYSAMVVAQLIK